MCLYPASGPSLFPSNLTCVSLQDLPAAAAASSPPSTKRKPEASLEDDQKLKRPRKQEESEKPSNQPLLSVADVLQKIKDQGSLPVAARRPQLDGSAEVDPVPYLKWLPSEVLEEFPSMEFLSSLEKFDTDPVYNPSTRPIWELFHNFSKACCLGMELLNYSGDVKAQEKNLQKEHSLPSIIDMTDVDSFKKSISFQEAYFQTSLRMEQNEQRRGGEDSLSGAEVECRRIAERARAGEKCFSDQHWADFFLAMKTIAPLLE